MELHKIGVVMGSASDLPVMEAACRVLDKFEIAYEVDFVSAHRTPEKLFEYGKQAHERGLKVLIAGAGGAAHLPGMLAALSPLPVIGVPILSRNSIDGWDSLLSIIQMPAGIPVATVALNNAENAALLAVQILATYRDDLFTALLAYRKKLFLKVEEQSLRLKDLGYLKFSGE